MENKLCEQDYLDIMTNYINSSIGPFWRKCYTVQDVVNHCVSKVEDIEMVDFSTIKKLAQLTIEQLLDSGHIIEYEKGLYRTKKYINPEQGIILEPKIPANTKATKEIAQAFDEIARDL